MQIVDENRGFVPEFVRADFGDDFKWGTVIAAFQVEGSVDVHGRGASIWDIFSHKFGTIKDAHHADFACDFYNRYESDLEMASHLGFGEFRFSLSWSRILPSGTGEINQAGIDFYDKIINKCLTEGLTPWVTLYHWDLPHALEMRGGWKNREVISWFGEFVEVCTKAFGDRVKNWIIINEPMAVAALGYTTGLHAPGKRGLWNFAPVVHHLAMCQSEGGRIVRANVPNAYIGTTFSCSFIEAHTDSINDRKAALRADALFNRLFIEPSLGLGYPFEAFSYLKNIKKYIHPGDEEKLKFDFDFIGLQNYFGITVQHSYLVPVLWLTEVSAKKRRIPTTAMGWEIRPEGLYQIIRQFDRYEGVKDIIISEGGAAFRDKVKKGEVNDPKRIDYFKQYLSAVLRSKEAGIPIKGYLVWSLMDNFEWAEGYHARFGLIYVDFKSQKRIVKSSGKWFRKFLKNK